jgi:hypothetical protein
MINALDRYPKDGRHGIDKGGWSIAEGSIKENGAARIEFKSGIGKFAKLLNGGKPFIDDLLVQVQDDGKVELRSSSRKGHNDFGVNKKRVRTLAQEIPSNWTTDPPLKKKL